MARPEGSKKRNSLAFSFDDWKVNDMRLPMTEEEFLEFCTLNPNLKIEQDKHGNIIIMSPATYETGNFESEIIADLGLWNRKTKLGKTFSSATMFILPSGEKRMPDAAWVSLEKHNQLSKWQRKQFAHIVPDFVIEVKSPSDSLEDLKKKMNDAWIGNGVQLAWLIDPEMKWSGFINQIKKKKKYPDLIKYYLAKMCFPDLNLI